MKRRDFLVATAGTLGTAPSVLRAAASAPCPAPNATLKLGSGSTKSISTPCKIPGSAAPVWLQGIPPFQWVALPSLSTSSALPTPVPPGMTGIRSVTDTWCGGALRENGSFYILHGGGHGDYAGNEIYALQLSLDNPQWTRIWGPTPNSAIIPDQYYYNDSPPSPAAIHTYYVLAFNDQDDIFMRFMRGQYILPNFTGGIDGIKWGAANWEQNQNNEIWPLPPPGWNYPDGQCKDQNGNVYLVNNRNRFLWNRGSNSWTTPIQNSAHAVRSSGCCFDSLRNTIWSFGGSYGGGTVGAGQAYMWNVSTNSEAVLNLTGPYASAIDGVNANNCGAIYDAVADRVFVLTGDTYVYVFDPSTHAVTRASTTGASLPSTTASTGAAPWGKFQYAPQLGGVVIQPTWESPTFFMRTH